MRFDRRELADILNIYSRMVAAGEWRDYAIDFLDDCAVFSVYRHASEVPLFRVEKRPSCGRSRDNMRSWPPPGSCSSAGMSSCNVLKVFERKLMKALAGS